MGYYVYIIASRPHGAIYVGCARDLRRRVEQHRLGAVDAHTKKYGIHRLLYFEHHDSLEQARSRERRLKRWRREWKDALIEQHNPLWRDICDQIPL